MTIFCATLVRGMLHSTKTKKYFISESIKCERGEQFKPRSQTFKYLFDDPTIGYLPGAYSLGYGLLGKIFLAVFETDIEFTRDLAFRIERSTEPQSTAFYFIHLPLRELLCSKIFHGSHNCSF